MGLILLPTKCKKDVGIKKFYNGSILNAKGSILLKNTLKDNENVKNLGKLLLNFQTKINFFVNKIRNKFDVHIPYCNLLLDTSLYY